MTKRIITGIIGVPLLIYIVSQGGLLLGLSLLTVVFLGLKEFYNAFECINISPLKHIGYFFTVFMYLIYFYYKTDIIPIIFFVITLSLLITYLFSKKHDFIDISVTLIGFIYISYFLIHILSLSMIDSHFIIWFVFLIAWATDTFAYFSGYFFGSKKLFPEVSPKKTVEGSIGGIIGSIAVCLLFTYLFNRDFIFHSVFLGFVGSIISQIGDLIASKVKRYVGIKDFGNIMPGHGGVLDRFDSILLTSPFVYYYVLLILKP